MTSLPLTKYEAVHILEDYRLLCWDGGTLDMQALQHVLTGAAWDGCDVRPDGVTEEHARRALDLHQDRWQRPPTARQLHQALDDALSSPAECKQIIRAARRQLATAKAGGGPGHQQLRAETDARRTRRTP